MIDSKHGLSGTIGYATLEAFGARCLDRHFVVVHEVFLDELVDDCSGVSWWKQRHLRNVRLVEEAFELQNTKDTDVILS